MIENLIWLVIVWGCAALFIGIGFYAERRKKPMWFWAGSSDKEIKVTDLKKHNKAHGIMWKKYSVWFWAAGIAYFFNEKIAFELIK